jgi:hypothetical protein
MPKTDQNFLKSAPLQTIPVRTNIKGLLGHLQVERKPWKKQFLLVSVLVMKLYKPSSKPPTS